MAGRFKIDSKRWVPRPRWRSWAASLFGRHLRRTAHPGGPGRVFPRPLSRPRSLVRERLLLASRTILASRALLPQIHLAIQPVLRERLWRDRSLLTVSSSLRTTAVSSEKSAEIREVTERTVERVLARPAVATAAGAPRPLPASPPIQLVFQRLRAPERALGVMPVARREDGLARQVAAKVRRVERQSPGAAPASRVMARREIPAVAASFDPPAGARTAPARWNGTQGPPSAITAAPAMPAIPAIPAINVDAVADQVMRQIDHRLHAWQERTGL